MSFFKIPIPKNVLYVALFAFVAIVFISFLKVAPEWEDAEQAYYSQWFRLGYNDQPPLYTWIQILVNKIIGVNRVSFAGVRALWFTGTLLMMYRLAKDLYKEERLAEITLWLLVLIPVFIDFTFRRLSHTSFMCFLSVSLYFVFSRLLVNKSWKNYLMFGAIIAGGLLAKYNFLMLLPTFILIPFFDKEAKKVFLDKKIWISLIACLLLISPHVYWLFAHLEYQDMFHQSMERKSKANLDGGIWIITPILAFVKSFLNLILPFLIIMVVMFFTKQVKLTKTKINWLVKMLIIQTALVLLIFTIVNSGRISERWLLPLYLPFSILLLKVFVPKNKTSWQRWGMRLFVFVILVQVLRTPFESLLGIDSVVHHSFTPVIDKLERNHPEKAWQLPDIVYAGSISYKKPGKTIFCADDFTLPKNALDSLNTVFVTKQKVEGLELIDSIMEFGYAKDNLYFYEKSSQITIQQ